MITKFSCFISGDQLTSSPLIDAIGNTLNNHLGNWRVKVELFTLLYLRNYFVETSI